MKAAGSAPEVCLAWPDPGRFAFSNSYAALPPRFYRRIDPTPVGAARLVALNAGLAVFLGLDAGFLASPAGCAVLAGNVVPAGAEPLAAAYAGHQFGNFVPRLGDGRAILLGELPAADGRRYDLQLKGAGPTPWSRMGDGRAALGPVLREYLVSEAMHALGIPTTRSLAAVATGETVWRETPLQGAVLARVASSHLRVGTVQYFAALQDHAALEVLVAYALSRHVPHHPVGVLPARALLDWVISRQATLVAQWMLVGFIHGVMNTDNCALSGETIDYGPCAFMDEYDPATVYSAIDTGGRYAYGNQPAIAHWNLARLAEALLPLLGPTRDQAIDAANDSLSGYVPQFQAAYRHGLARKLGLSADPEQDWIARALLDAMAAHRADYTTSFGLLADAVGQATPPPALAPLATGAHQAWYDAWQRRLAAERDPAAAMRAANPHIIPRNHQVAAVLAEAEAGNLAPFHAFHAALATPCAAGPATEPYRAPPRPEQRVSATFCGT